MKNLNENSKVTLTFEQLKRLVKEATDYTYIDTAINEAEENIVPVKFDKAGLMELGFRKMYGPDYMLWAAALPDSLVFSNQYISVVCGNNNGNREVDVSLNTDNNGPEWVMINPTEENLIELFDTMLPERLLKDTTKFKIRY